MLKQNAYVEYCNTGSTSVIQYVESTITNCVPIQVVVYDNRAGVAHDSLCAVPVRRRLPTIIYVQSCDELCSWFHALDHTNYARWLPVHVSDMVQLAHQNHERHAEFMKGNLVVQKSRRKFSLMAKDQAHELSNKILQTKGGAAGLYGNHEALMLFMLAGPDCARMVEEFEAIDPQPTTIFNRTSRGGAHLASDIPK